MGIEIPESLQWVAKYVVGAGDWPEGDETAMRRVEEAWTGLAADLRDLGPDANHAIDQVLASIEGDTAQAISDRWTELGHGQGAFDGLIQHIETLGEEIGDGATDIEYTKLVIIASLAIFAVEMAVALAVAATGVGAPAAGAQAAAAQVTTRIAIRTAIKQLLQRMMSKAALHAAARAAVRGAWEGALEETVMDLGVKSVQVLAGTRDGITTEDLTEAGKNAVTAAATGAVTSGLEGLTSRGSPDGPSGSRNGTDPDPDAGDPGPPRRTGDPEPPGEGSRNRPDREGDPNTTGENGNGSNAPGNPNTTGENGNGSNAPGNPNTTGENGNGSNAPGEPEGENPYVNAAWDGAAAAGTDLAETVTDDAVGAALDEDEEFSWEETLSPENLASSASAGVETGVGTLMEGGSNDSGPDRDSDPPNQRNDPPPAPRSPEDPPGSPPRQEGDPNRPEHQGEQNPSGRTDGEGSQNAPGNPNTTGENGNGSNAPGRPDGENPFVNAARDAAAEAGTDLASSVTEEAVAAALDEEEEFSWDEALSPENVASATSAGVETGVGTLMEGGSDRDPDPPNQQNAPPPTSEPPPASSQDPGGNPPQPPAPGVPAAAGPPESQQTTAAASSPPAAGPSGGPQPPAGPGEPAAGNQGAPPAGSPPGSPPPQSPSSLNITGAGETPPPAPGAPAPGPATPEETSTSAASTATATAAPPPVAPAAAPTQSPEAPRAASGDPVAAAPGAATSANAARARSGTGKPRSADPPNRGDGAGSRDEAGQGGPAPSPTLPNTPGFDYNLFDPAHHARVLADMSRPPIPTRPVRTTPDENIWSSDDHRSPGSPSAIPGRTDNCDPSHVRADRPGPTPGRDTPTPGSARPADGPSDPAHGVDPSSGTSAQPPASGPGPEAPSETSAAGVLRRPYWNEPRPTDPIWNSPYQDASVPGRNSPSTPDHGSHPPRTESPAGPRTDPHPTPGSRASTETASSNPSRADTSGHTTPTGTDTSPASGRPNPVPPGAPAPTHPGGNYAVRPHEPGATPSTRSPGRPPLPPGRTPAASPPGSAREAAIPAPPDPRGMPAPAASRPGFAPSPPGHHPYGPVGTWYATTPLQPEFQGEHLPGNRQWGNKFVKYLSPAERAPYRLFAHNGLLYTCQRQPLDTTCTSTLWTPQGGRAIFVMDEHGQLYASPHHVLGEFHHSSLLAGGPVAGAGEIAAVQGWVQLISDHSTHYRPPRRFTGQVVDSLVRQGIAFDERAVEYHYPPDPNGR